MFFGISSYTCIDVTDSWAHEPNSKYFHVINSSDTNYAENLTKCLAQASLTLQLVTLQSSLQTTDSVPSIFGILTVVSNQVPCNRLLVVNPYWVSKRFCETYRSFTDTLFATSFTGCVVEPTSYSRTYADWNIDAREELHLISNITKVMQIKVKLDRTNMIRKTL